MNDTSVSAPPILAALRQLSTGSLYSLGDKSLLFSALQLCQRNAVNAPRWHRGRSSLSAEVNDTGVYEVELELVGGRIASTCDCKKIRSSSACAHRLAVLLTLKKALMPTAVSGWRPDQQKLAAIRLALLETPLAVAPGGKKKGRTAGASKPRKTQAPRDEFAIEVSEQYGSPIIEVTRNGIPALPFDPRLPLPLQPLQALPYYPFGGRPAAGLVALLDRGELSWPVVLRDEDGRRQPLIVEPPVPRRGRLRLDGRADGLWVERLLDDGRPLGGHLIWFGSWVIDREQRRLLPVAAPPIWDLWPHLLGIASRPGGEGGYRIDWPVFSALELVPGEGEAPPLEDLALQHEGVEQAPARALLAAYRVDVVPTEADDFTLHPGVAAGGRALPLDRRALALFTERFFEHCTVPLRAFKRRRVLFETYFAAREATAKTERNRILRSALQGPDFRKRRLAREARERLNDCLALADEPSWLLTFADDHWLLSQRDRQREDRLLAILYRHFGEPALRQASGPGDQKLSRPAFFTALPVLRAELEGAGIELRFAGRALTPTRLDIHVAAHSADIDWFELRPEIRCGDVLLDAESWRQALEQGMFEAGGKLHLLDAKDREALAILAGLSGPATPSRREIVRIPRLHILDLLALRRLGATLELAAADATILASLEHFEDLPAVVEPRLDATLRDYQRLGYRWLAFLYRHKFGACLADDMGLGKTIQAISLLAALQQGHIAPRAAAGTPHLVVMPPSLLFNWENEIARFAPSLRTLLYRGQERSTAFGEVDVVLTSYELVRRDIDRLAAIPFHVIIFDETQVVKNVHAAVTGAARRLQGAFKVALTGTPVENHLGEYWSIIDLVLPGLLGPYRRFGNARDAVDHRELERLIARTRPFLLRRTKEKIAAELPDKVEIDLQLELTGLQKTLYQQTVAAVRSEVAVAWQRQTAAQARITALAALTRLRRLCLDPRLVEPAAPPEASPKIDALGEYLEELRDEGHSALVFSQFTTFLDLVEPELAARGIPYLRLDGSTPVAARKELVETFQRSTEPLVFLLSLKAGGRGLNLTRASYVIHLDPWWNPAVENQASDRAHRIGQTRKVTVLRLLMRHTVEEKMMVLKERKQGLYRALLDEGRGGGGAPLTREDFEFLVG
jgi:non-specific serine/threonine protein kinase